MDMAKRKKHNLPPKETLRVCRILGHTFVENEWYPGKFERICLRCGMYKVIHDPNYPHCRLYWLKMLQEKHEKGEIEVVEISNKVTIRDENHNYGYYEQQEK